MYLERMSDSFELFREYFFPSMCGLSTLVGIFFGLHSLYKKQYQEGYEKGEKDQYRKLQQFFYAHDIHFIQRNPQQRDDVRYENLDTLLENLGKKTKNQDYHL
ncbi:MAG: hypothetical protein QT08_C0008G0016 [archaeon GW2011_AR17]|nr:MAG: hypothetical protein QT08_C0008G0016 [archaeon GW2011_AR17]